MKIWSSRLLDNLSNCLMNLKNSGDSTGFEPMTSAMPVQCSNPLSTAPASQRSWVRIPLSHLNFSGSWDNCLNCPASARIISSVDFKHKVPTCIGLMFSRERNIVWKKCYMKCRVWNQMKIWSSHLLDNLSNCLINLKNSGGTTGFEPMSMSPTNWPALNCVTA